MTTLRLTGARGADRSIDQHAVSALAAGLDGHLLRPGDEGFDEATRIWMSGAEPPAVS